MKMTYPTPPTMSNVSYPWPEDERIKKLERQLDDSIIRIENLERRINALKYQSKDSE